MITSRAVSKPAAIILAVVALLVGVVAGGWSVAAFHGRLTSRLFISSLTLDTSTTVDTLRRLRAGDTPNAVELLEIQLDGDLIGLGTFFIADPRELKRDPSYSRTLQMARDYRAQFPRKSRSPKIDEDVAKAFTLLDEQTKH